jgi:hypothetical protein
MYARTNICYNEPITFVLAYPTVYVSRFRIKSMSGPQVGIPHITRPASDQRVKFRMNKYCMNTVQEIGSTCVNCTNMGIQVIASRIEDCCSRTADRSHDMSKDLICVLGACTECGRKTGPVESKVGCK